MSASPTDDPGSPIEAVTHPAPYAYYARLAAERPIHRDDDLGLWVVTGAASVEAALTHPHARVRPATEPVPAALVGSTAGAMFRDHVRMNDGERHVRLRQAVVPALAGTGPDRVEAASDAWADVLWTEAAGRPDGDLMRDFAFPLPVYVTASLLGLADRELSPVAALMADFVACFAPGSPPERIERGKLAAERLAEIVGLAAERRRERPSDDLLSALVAGAATSGFDAVGIAVANGIGLLAQSYEATAGLIGNALMALDADPGLRHRLSGDGQAISRFIEEVLRFDPPVHNTRRFFADAARIGAAELRPGDGLLVLLAAANRDPALNADPERFDIDRREIRHVTFGAGVHQCPGAEIARRIAAAAIRQSLRPEATTGELAKPVTYRPSANARVPRSLAVGHRLQED